MPSRGIIRYVVRRAAILAVTILITLTIVFFLFSILPGNAALVRGGLEATSTEQQQFFIHQMGLDKPVWERYVTWIWNLLHGDLGKSLLTGQEILPIVLQRAPVTLVLAITSMIFGITFSIPAGIIAAVKRGSWIDSLVSVVSLGGIAAPTYFLALILILVFSVWLQILPSRGIQVDYLQQPFLTNFQRLILPAVALGSGQAALLTRVTRSSMLDVLQLDYVTAVRARGLPFRLVVFRHVLKNAAIPILTIAGLEFAVLMGGAIITEQIFGIPGIGQLVLYAAQNRDYIVMEAVILFIALAVILINFTMDIIYKVLDPRIKG